MKAWIFVLLIGITLIIIAAIMATISYFIIRAAFKRNQCEYEEMFKRLKARIAGESYPRYSSCPELLVITLDEAMDCIDRIAEEYAVGRIYKDE